MALDAVIIGAGPGGLATAHALLAARPSARIGAYERMPDLRPRGGIITLAPYGIHSLNAINDDLVSALSRSAIEFSDVRETDKFGTRLIPSRKSEKSVNRNRGYLTQRWSFLQRTLHENLPKRVVHLGHTFVSCQENGDEIEVHLLDENGEEFFVKSHLLIGADGYNSRVRSFCNNDGSPVFDGTLIWRHFMTTRQTEHTIDHGGPDLVSGRIFIGDNKKFALFQSKETEFFSAYIQQSEIEKEAKIRPIKPGMGVHLDGEGVDSREKDILLRIFQDWSPEVIKAISRADPGSILKRGEYIRDPEQMKEHWFGKGRVALLGDAVHPAPATGSGANLAVFEAHQLGLAVQKHGFTTTALKEYRTRNFESIKNLVCASFEAGMNYMENQQLENPVYDEFQDRFEKFGRILGAGEYIKLGPGNS